MGDDSDSIEAPKVSTGAQENSRLDPNVEFSELDAVIKSFFWVTGFLQSINRSLDNASGDTDLSIEDSIWTHRFDVMNIISSISDIDDDVTACWMNYLLSEELLNEAVDARETLRASTEYGVSAVMSREKLVQSGVVTQDFFSKPSLLVMGLFFPFDLFCVKEGLEPIALKMYSGQAVNLATQAARSDLFVNDKVKAVKCITSYAAMLRSVIRLVENPDDLEIDLLWQSLSDLRAPVGTFEDVDECFRYLDLMDKPLLGSWANKFLSKCRSIGTTESAVASESRGLSTLEKLEHLSSLFEQDLLTEEEYETKISEISRDK